MTALDQGIRAHGAYRPLGALVPHYLSENDLPWLDELIECYDRSVQKTRAMLNEMLAVLVPENPISLHKFDAARHVLDQHYLTKPAKLIPAPSAMRFRLCTMTHTLASSELCSRADALNAAFGTVAKECGLSIHALQERLFQDFPMQQPLVRPLRAIDAHALRLRANNHIVAQLLFRAQHVRISCWGNSRPVVRQARLSGLMAIVRRPSNAAERVHGNAGAATDRMTREEGVVIDISGPLVVLHNTLVYGRLLTQLLPFLLRCRRFEMLLRVLPRAGNPSQIMRVTVRDPLAREHGPESYDSRLERRFAEAFKRATQAWDLVREPEPFAVAGELVFPDFAIAHRIDRESLWYLEIVGFWTPEYLERKMRIYAHAGIRRLILCVPAKRAEGFQAAVPRCQFVVFKTVIRAEHVLRIIETPTARQDAGKRSD